MNRQQLLLTMLAEECAETAQRASKCIRFTPEEIQDGQDQTNAQRLVYEFNDIVAIMRLLLTNGIIDKIFDDEAINLKYQKVEKWMQHSKNVGTLNEL